MLRNINILLASQFININLNQWIWSASRQAEAKIKTQHRDKSPMLMEREINTAILADETVYEINTQSDFW